MAYGNDYDKLSSGLGLFEAIENQHQRVHLFELEFGAPVCIEQVSFNLRTGRRGADGSQD